MVADSHEFFGHVTAVDIVHERTAFPPRSIWRRRRQASIFNDEALGGGELRREVSRPSTMFFTELRSILVVEVSVNSLRVRALETS